MRESIGSSQLLLIVVTIIIVIMMLLAGSIGYSKAFKARNAIINIIQENATYGMSASAILSDSDDEIGAILNEMGYKTSMGAGRNCRNHNSIEKYSLYEAEKSTNYNYCIYHYEDKLTGNQYYGVETYMYFELPIFGRTDMFVIPIYGDTYTFFKMEEGSD